MTRRRLRRLLIRGKHLSRSDDLEAGSDFVGSGALRRRPSDDGRGRSEPPRHRPARTPLVPNVTIGLDVERDRPALAGPRVSCVQQASWRHLLQRHCGGLVSFDQAAASRRERRSAFTEVEQAPAPSCAEEQGSGLIGAAGVRPTHRRVSGWRIARRSRWARRDLDSFSRCTWWSRGRRDGHTRCGRSPFSVQSDVQAVSRCPSSILRGR